MDLVSVMPGHDLTSKGGALGEPRTIAKFPVGN